MLPRVAILIPSKNDEMFIGTTLLSLFREAACYRDAGGSVTICAVNDGSTDRTPAVMAGMRGLSPVEFTFIDRAENKGVTYSLDEAFTAVGPGAEVVLRCDADARFIRSGWLQTMVSFLMSDERVGAVAPLMVFPDGTVDSHGVDYLPLGRTLVLHNREYFAQPIAPIAEVDAVLGAYCLMRTSDWQIDTGYYLWREDEDQCLVLRQKGKKCFSIGLIEVVHYNRMRRARVSERVSVADWQRQNAPAVDRRKQFDDGARLIARAVLPEPVRELVRRVVRPRPAAPPAPSPSARIWAESSARFASRWGFPNPEPWVYTPPEKRKWSDEDRRALAASAAGRLLGPRYQADGGREGQEIIGRYLATHPGGLLGPQVTAV
ncbi:MAG: glycosyltransferase [Vicinamibacteria bacterium]|jgi:GT2 family glycosyltransferase|nr:glycosyltransferase [Vicinamibacteria bacterium]